MKQQQDQSDSVHALLTDLKSCSMRRDLQWGRKVHAKAIERRNNENMYVVTAIVNMYARCGSMVDARYVFDSVQKPDVVSWTAVLLGYAANGDGIVALEMFWRMQACGCAPDSVTYVAALKACSSLGKKDCLKLGRKIHSNIGCYLNHYVQNALIEMYAKSGSMLDAREVFHSIQNPDVVSWSALILGYAEDGNGIAALETFSRMKACGCNPSSLTYIAAIKACTSLAVNGDKEDCLKRGRKIHSEIGSHMNPYVQCTLIDMYAKCGSMIDARLVFDSAQEPDVVAWTAMLLGYADNGDGIIGLDMFLRMKACGCTPNSVTYIAALKACTSLAINGKEDCLKWGRKIHSEIGCHLNHYIQCTLIGMYSKCGTMVEARAVFDSVRNPDVVSWNTLLQGYAENGDGKVALEMFSKMKRLGFSPDSVTYVAALKACVCLAGNRKEDSLKLGREIHLEIGCHSNIYVQSALIEMYAKCGSTLDAREVFDNIEKPNVLSCNTLLLGYVDNGDGVVALEMFWIMKARGCTFDSVTYIVALKACTSLAVHDGKQFSLTRGREIHSEIGCHLNHYVQSALIDMYAKCGCIVDARGVFDSIQDPDVVSWNALVLGYAENGDGLAALEMFSRMRFHRVPNSVTYIAAFKACTTLALKEESLRRGRQIHMDICCNCHFNQYVQNTLIDMYGKCGSMVEACAVFYTIQKPDVVSWTALLLGYAENGEGLVALEMFSRMKTCGCKPDSVTYIAVLKACSLIGALALGRKFHKEINQMNTCLVTCLVDLYSKCGSMLDARAVFDMHSKTRDSWTWTALLSGYGGVGDTDSVFNLFKSMQDEGFHPNAITFVCMLLCCNHAGLVGKAREYFEIFPSQFEVTPTVIHYNCMVDILGRANQLSEAFAMMRKMPCDPDPVTWRILLGACCKWKTVWAGKLAFQSLVDVDKKDASAYVLMAHLYGSIGMWEEQERVLETSWSFKLIMDDKIA